jgi:hypothetical protein
MLSRSSLSSGRRCGRSRTCSAKPCCFASLEMRRQVLRGEVGLGPIGDFYRAVSRQLRFGPGRGRAGSHSASRASELPRFHDIRHAYATSLLAAGLGSHAVAALPGDAGRSAGRPAATATRSRRARDRRRPAQRMARSEERPGVKTGSDWRRIDTCAQPAAENPCKSGDGTALSKAVARVRIPPGATQKSPANAVAILSVRARFGGVTEGQKRSIWRRIGAGLAQDWRRIGARVDAGWAGRQLPRDARGPRSERLR